MKQWTTSLRAAFSLVLLLTLLLGLAYPLAITSAAQVLFTKKASGSLIHGDGVLGSALIGQPFEHSRYFWPRPSAADYNASASSASNIGAGSKRLLEVVNARIAALQQADPENKAPIPVDLVTASGSGLDPHISLAAAQYQLPRVARVRHLPPHTLELLMEKYTVRPGFGLLGDPYVNVVLLNAALEEE